MSTIPSAAPFPERDSTKPAEQQGLFRKFDIRRTDGSDQPGGKHYGCRYFVLDMTHDQHAPAALRAYAASCESTHPQLAADLVSEFGAPTEGMDELRKAVRAITRMLSDREWAEHVSRDLDASALEAAITDLHNDLSEANERIDELEAQHAEALQREATDYNEAVDEIARQAAQLAAPDPMLLVKIRNVALEEAAQIADHQYSNEDTDPLIENVNVAMRNAAAAIRELRK
jgi:hypothetical protein